MANPGPEKQPVTKPAEWIRQNESALPRHGRALDVASGEGRHAIWLASRGLEVTAFDRDEGALEYLRRAARDSAVSVATRCIDLEQTAVSLGVAAFDVIVVTNFLHRPLFPSIQTALAPGGVLIYETFTRAQATIGRPTNPAFLLETGELERLVSPLEILRSREGFFDGRHVASVLARLP